MLDIDTLKFVPVHNGMYGKPGVYFIKEDGILVYIGMSGFCAKKVLYRHFATWTDRRVLYVRDAVDRVSYNDGRLERHTYTVCILVTGDGEKAHDLEKELIRYYNPRDNKQKYLYYMDKESLTTLIQEVQKLNIDGYCTENIF